MADADAIWNAVGWSLAALAALTLLLALLGDALRRRFRRMRRCPKCWYDLSHTPGMRCSECGYTARRERQLFRTRRRKRWVLAALLVWLGSYFAFRAPAMQQRGWVAAVPTTAFVFIAPFLQTDSDGNYSWGSGTLPDEIIARSEAGRLADWQWRLLIRNAIRAGKARFRRTYTPGTEWNFACFLLLDAAASLDRPAEAEAMRESRTLCGYRITTRPRWPVGSTVLARVEPVKGYSHSTVYLRLSPLDPPGGAPLHESRPSQSTNFSPSDEDIWYWSDGLVPIAAPPAAGARLKLRTEGWRITDHLGDSDESARSGAWKHDVSVRTEIRGAIDDLLTPVESPEFEQMLLAQGNFQLIGDRLWMISLRQPLTLLDGATFAARFEVLDGETVVATAQAWWGSRGSRSVIPSVRDVQLSLVSEAPRPSIDRQIEGLRLRIRSDPEMVLRRFDCDRYWSGEVVVPVTWFTPPWE